MSQEITCKFCGKPIKIWRLRKNIKFINTEQNFAVLYFCEMKCKLNWIYQIQNWNILEKKYFQETRELPYRKENKFTIKYEKWLNGRLEQIKKSFEEIKKVK